MAAYYEGALVRTKAAFTDPNNNNAPIDPTTVTLKWHRITDPLTTWAVAGNEIIKDSTGNYHADLDTTNLPGHWSYEYEGTGTAQAANAGAFYVESS